MSVQFIIGRPGFLLYPFNSLCVAWRGILESSVCMTCSNHLSLRSLIMSSSFLKPVFFLISSFFTLSFMKFPTICIGTYHMLPLVSSSVWQTVAIGDLPKREYLIIARSTWLNLLVLDVDLYIYCLTHILPSSTQAKLTLPGTDSRAMPHQLQCFFVSQRVLFCI